MSSTKRILDNYLWVNAQSMAATFQSSSLTVPNFDRFSLQIAVTTSDAAGSIAIQGSVDGTTWVNLPLDFDAVSSANKNYFIDFVECGLSHLRINYTRVSGTGSMTARLFARES